MLWSICNSIVVLFELFGLFVILLWIINGVLQCDKPKWFKALVKTFLVDFEDYDDD